MPGVALVSLSEIDDSKYVFMCWVRRVGDGQSRPLPLIIDASTDQHGSRSSVATPGCSPFSFKSHFSLVCLFCTSLTQEGYSKANTGTVGVVVLWVCVFVPVC